MRADRSLSVVALGLVVLIGCGAKERTSSPQDHPAIPLKNDPPVVVLPKGQEPTAPIVPLPEQVPVTDVDKAKLDELQKKGASVFGPQASGGYIVGIGRDASAAALVPLLRGLKCVVELSIENEALTDESVQHLDGIEYLERLSLLRCATVNGANFGVLAKLPRLKVLAFVECPLTDAACKPIGQCRKLEEVAFNSSRITDTGLRELNGVPGLVSISLYSTPVTGSAFAVPGWAKLRFIEAPNSHFDDTGLEATVGLPALETLDIRATKVTDAGATHFDCAKKLVDLNLSHTAVGDVGLSAIGKLPALKELHLEETKATDAGIAALGAVRTLRILNLEKTSVTGAAFAKFEHPSALRKLNLNGTKFNDAGGAHLARFTALTNLSLTACPVTDAGLTALGTLKKLTNLDLSGTKAGDGAAKLVGTLPELEIVSFNETLLTDTGLKDAARGAGLKFLYARDTKVTKRGVIEAGAFARPGVKIDAG